MIKQGDKFRIKGLELTVYNTYGNTVVLTYISDNITKFAMVKTQGLLKVLSTYKVLNLAA